MLQPNWCSRLSTAGSTVSEANMHLPVPIGHAPSVFTREWQRPALPDVRADRHET